MNAERGWVLGIDPGVGRWDGVGLAWGPEEETGDVIGAWNQKDSLALRLTDPGLLLVVIEWPDWEGEERSRRGYGSLVEECQGLKHAAEARRVRVLIPSRAEIHRLAFRGHGYGEPRDRWVREQLQRCGYGGSFKRGCSLSNRDRRDACAAALFGIEKLKREEANRG